MELIKKYIETFLKIAMSVVFLYIVWDETQEWVTVAIAFILLACAELHLHMSDLIRSMADQAVQQQDQIARLTNLAQVNSKFTIAHHDALRDVMAIIDSRKSEGAVRGDTNDT